MLKEDLELLKTPDIYSMSMFMLYKLVEDPDYTSISELPYILDKKNLLQLCEYFGGQVIKIPTVAELYSVLNGILIYQYVKIEGLSFEQALKLTGYRYKDLRPVKNIYNKISKVLDKYEFSTRANN